MKAKQIIWGLVFAAMAGYNPQVAIDFWKRIGQHSNNSSTPAFLSSHPSDAKRIADIQKTTSIRDEVL